LYRIFKPSSDTYITDKIVKRLHKTTANVGLAASIDLFVLYGITFSGSVPNHELSRALIKFDLTDLHADYAAGKFDITNPTFNCTLKMFDVYGGQSTPDNFSLQVYPLSRSFQEGIGRDVIFFQDSDASNFITATFDGSTPSVWFLSGANAKGALGNSSIDVISTADLGAGTVSLTVSQSFVVGDENLSVDVTRIVSATLAGLIPDKGFRVSFSETDENALATKFVKRFGSSNASNPYIRPQLIMRYNDAINSHESNFLFDVTGTLVLYNYVRGELRNFVSGSSNTALTGQNSMLVKLTTPVSTSNGFIRYETHASASQHRIGSSNVTGIYSSTFALSSNDPFLRTKLQQSGSIMFQQVWTSTDRQVPYFSGSLTVYPNFGTTGPATPKRYNINITNMAEEYTITDIARMRLFIFDYSSPMFKLVKTPLETPSVVLENVFYSVRDAITNTVLVPFDRIYSSTKLSSDSEGMYFDIWMTSLLDGRAYVVDIMLVEGSKETIYRNVGPAFRVLTAGA